MLRRSNPNHEPAGSPEGGQFASGDGGGGGGAAESGSKLSGKDAWLDADDGAATHKIVSDAYKEIESLSIEIGDAVDELDAAVDERKEIEQELGPEDQYTDPADQEDWEKRVEEAGKEAGAKAFAARDKIKALVDKAQKRLDEINAKLAKLNDENYEWEKMGAQHTGHLYKVARIKMKPDALMRQKRAAQRARDLDLIRVRGQ